MPRRPEPKNADASSFEGLHYDLLPNLVSNLTWAHFCAGKVAGMSFSHYGLKRLEADATKRRIASMVYRSGQRDASRRYAHFPVTEHQAKTYGGGLIIAAIVLSALLWCKLHNLFAVLCLAGMLWFAALGAVDDYMKVRYGSSDRGLSEGAKLGKGRATCHLPPHYCTLSR